MELSALILKSSTEMARQSVRRASYRVIFGEGDQRWSMADPGHPLVSEADHRVHYGRPLEEVDRDAMLLASVARDMAYLVHTCPSTKLACEKLAAMRAAVRKLGPSEE